MIGKITKGSGFKGCVSYVLKKNKANLLTCSGVLGESIGSIIQSFTTQRLMNPDIEKPVGHISLSYSVEDAPKLDDKKMIELAHEYMKEMGITDTQYIVVRHHDREHPHVHIVFNRINNNGKTISDRNDRYRNEQVCKRLKLKYGLYFAPGKERVKQNRLQEPDKTKYQIYHAVKNALEISKSWQQLQNCLVKDGIKIQFKYKGQTDLVQGVSFIKGDYCFKGSEIDRDFSYSKLKKRLDTSSQYQQVSNTMKTESLVTGKMNANMGIADLFNFSVTGCLPDDCYWKDMEEPIKKKKKKRKLRL